MDLKALRAFVSNWLVSHGKENHLIGWKWQVVQENVDYAAPLQAYHLTLEQESQLVADLAAEFPNLEGLGFVNGFLNMRLGARNWGKLLQDWLANPADFLEEALIPADMWELTIFWRYRMLKTFHEAAMLARLEGWLSNELLDYQPKNAELHMLKMLLSLGGMLQQKRNLHEKRLQMMTHIQEHIAELWQEPILTPTDTAGSAWRQGLLQIALVAAEAIGAPSKQSLSASLHIHD